MSEQQPYLSQLLKVLDEIHAIDVLIIDVRDQTSVTDYMVICNGRASRHVKAIAESALEKMKTLGLPALSQTGLENGEWALIDFGDIVLHVMQPDCRAFYNLEELWQHNPHD